MDASLLLTIGAGIASAIVTQIIKWFADFALDTEIKGIVSAVILLLVSFLIAMGVHKIIGQAMTFTQVMASAMIIYHLAKSAKEKKIA